MKKVQKVDSLPEEIVKKCKNFADRTMKEYKDEYTKRGQSNSDKIREDFLVGQLGVAHVINLYEKLGFNMPDRYWIL